MPKGSLRIIVTDLVDDPINGEVTVDLTRAEGGSRGVSRTGEFALSDGDVVVELKDIPCQDGFGTTYRVAVSTRNFRRFQFLQRIKPNRVVNGSANPLGLVARPGRVARITGAPYSRLTKSQRAFLEAAEMRAPEPEDRDLLTLTGKGLYEALGPLRQAGLLNIFVKSRHPTADNCFRHVIAPLVVRQDRCFCRVDSAMDDFLNDSQRFEDVSGSLHDPLAGYKMLEPSYKSKDSHANIQVTIMQHTRTGELAADIDIDEARGLKHGFEVVRNTIARQRTNPYLIRELLLLQDRIKKSLNPKYRFEFK